jgi:hypothetical protein
MSEMKMSEFNETPRELLKYIKHLQDRVKQVDELENRIAKAKKHLPENPGMALGFLLRDEDES